MVAVMESPCDLGWVCSLSCRPFLMCKMGVMTDANPPAPRDGDNGSQSERALEPVSTTPMSPLPRDVQGRHWSGNAAAP